MANLPVTIVGKHGSTGQTIEAEVRGHHDNEHRGLVVLTDRLLEFEQQNNYFLNDTFGSAMNQNVTFGGTPEIIHNGGSSVEWTGSAIAGAWNFADGGKVSLTAGDTGDEATFAEETPTTIDLSGFTTLTGKINLTIYNAANNTLSISFDNAGTPVGVSVDIDDYIDTGLIGAEQSFAIPKADMGLTTQLVDGFTVSLSRTGGTKPTMTFDDIQLEETGASAVFVMSTPANTKYYIDAIRLNIVDNVTGITTVVGATENATMTNISYDAILGVSALGNGIVFKRTQNGIVKESETLHKIGDFLEIGANIVNLIGDGTNTYLTLEIPYKEPIIMDGNGAENNISLTINDNLSGLLGFTAIAIGSLELEPQS